MKIFQPLFISVETVKLNEVKNLFLFLYKRSTHVLLIHVFGD
jgi:hypothetical protein